MSEHITHPEGTKRLERSSDRVLGGVSGGLGRYFDLSPAVFRLGFVVLTLLGGAGILVYLAAVLVIPDEGKERSIAEEALASRRDRPWAVVGLGLVAVALAVLLSRASAWPAAGAGWLLVLVAGLVLLWTHERRSDGTTRSRSVVRWLVGTFVALVVAAVAAISVAFAWFDVSLGDGIGDRSERPASVEQLRPTYAVGIGRLRLDLSDIGPVTEETRVDARVGIGSLEIVLPDGVPAAVDAHAEAGDVDVFDRHDDGRDVSVRLGSGLLVVEADVGAGRVDVERAVR
jgi:phage shock protein PspC (stress-responsive transcriptional regulator)